MLLIYCSLHQLLLQPMCSLHPERGRVAYPGPGSAPPSSPGSTRGRSRVRVRAETPLCRFSTSEHRVGKRPSWEGDCCERAEGHRGQTPAPTPEKGFLRLPRAQPVQQPRADVGPAVTGSFAWRRTKTLCGMGVAPAIPYIPAWS